MMFTDAHTPSTVCSPTRYAVLTGRYAWREPRIIKNVLRANDKPVIETERKTAYERITNTNHYSMDGLRGVKRDLWEGGHRIPFIVRWPGKIPASSVNHETICLVDFMATIAAITGYELCAPDCEDSYSILPALLGEKSESPLRNATVHHAPNADLAIRKGDWVFIDAALGDISDEPAWFRKALGAEEHHEEKELFNLAEDPQQIINLYSSFPGKAEELRNELVRIINGQNHYWHQLH
ncbi:MAG: sulfatase-like hydrolase/transferase [Bacteroidetes bacterium]|nr:sulfatase-like hydrolase/transferase [Bacteroidota bacterium]